MFIKFLNEKHFYNNKILFNITKPTEKEEIIYCSEKVARSLHLFRVSVSCTGCIMWEQMRRKKILQLNKSIKILDMNNIQCATKVARQTVYPAIGYNKVTKKK